MLKMYSKHPFPQFCFYLFLSFLLCTVQAQQTRLPATTVNRIDSIFSSYNRPSSPGYALGIFKDQKIAFTKGYGMASLEYNIPLTAYSVFNIASLSKQFTAACIALLIVRNSISLED